ncbi:MAG: hypothetical protein AAFV90_27135 [Cyanobacteria bacterium J06634_5]
MQGYYETETEIPVNHQLTVKVPDNIPPGRVKLALIYDIGSEASSTKAVKKALMSEFLASLSEHPSSELSRAEIQDYIDEERQSWD